MIKLKTKIIEKTHKTFTSSISSVQPKQTDKRKNNQWIHKVCIYIYVLQQFSFLKKGLEKHNGKVSGKKKMSDKNYLNSTLNFKNRNKF